MSARPAPEWADAEARAGDLAEALILASGLAGAGLGGILLGSLGASLGLLIGVLLGGSYVERPTEDRR